VIFLLAGNLNRTEKTLNAKIQAFRSQKRKNQFHELYTKPSQNESSAKKKTETALTFNVL